MTLSPHSSTVREQTENMAKLVKLSAAETD